MEVIARFIANITRRFYPRGTQRMLRLFLNPKKLKIRTVMPYDRDLRINVDTSLYVEWELFFRGYYEKWVIDLTKKILKEGGVAIDAGANIGTHALIMAKLVGSNGRVLAFEPDPKSMARLKENISLNHFMNVKIFQCGLSAKSGSMKLFSYSDEMPDHGTASFYKLASLQQSEIQVQIQTLDEVLENENVNRLDFMKIDTRGSDFPIILGAKISIEKFRPYVVFEYNQDNWRNSNSRWEEARKFFNEHNYDLYNVTPKGTYFIKNETEGKTSYNILAMPKEKTIKL